MNVRRTAVSWDPSLIRVEFLDEQGNPYYCWFEATPSVALAEASEPAAEKVARRARRRTSALAVGQLASVFSVICLHLR